jgi:hypothetical protein
MPRGQVVAGQEVEGDESREEWLETNTKRAKQEA